MFPQKRRIKKDLFPLLTKGGLFLKSPQLSLRSVKQKNPNSPSLFAVVVSNKVSKLATERNFLKRRTRALLCSLLKKIKNGYYLVFYVNDRSLGQTKTEELKKQIEYLLTKSKTINV